MTTSLHTITRNTPVRMGVLNLLTLIIALCLAVLAVLSLTTAHRSELLSKRQSEHLQNVFIAEQVGQEFLAEVDTELAILVAQGYTPNTMAATLQNIPFQPSVHQNVSHFIQDADNTVTATFTTPSNQSLTCVLTISSNGTYEITEWKSVKLWNEEVEGEQLLRTPKTTEIK